MLQYRGKWGHESKLSLYFTVILITVNTQMDTRH